MEPWYKVTELRKEVREGRSFNPDEFAIALEQVVAGTAPRDYRDPQQFFSRTCFTAALIDHSCMVLRRLAGETDNTAPVLTLITQFGGGKTHTLASLYHIVSAGKKAEKFEGVPALLKKAGLKEVPPAKVAVFVGNAWDPLDGRETPWIDLAWQLAGEKGVEALGKSAKTTPPGTVALNRLYEVAGGSVLILCDEVLNFFNRHRPMAEGFYAFLQNLTVSMTGTPRSAALISLPRSQIEMTDWDLKWQDKITKVVRRVAKDLISNNQAEIGEVVRRRLFEDLGDERIRHKVAKAYADWCFERRAQLPPEWTAVDTAATEAKAREYLRERFETCYPFHPATLSVFQRKWMVLPHYQQTRGTLAMLAQWISRVARDSFTAATREPLITLGSAPLDVPEFRSVILGQLGETRLLGAIETDISGEQSHAKALDADSKGNLRMIHTRVGATILFESSGGQVDKVAHLPELRFALGEPGMDTTSIDNAAYALEKKAYFIRPIGSDGFRIHYKPTLKKVVNDRMASLDEESEVKPATRRLIEQEFKKGASLGLNLWPTDGAAIPDSPRLTLVVVEPEKEWSGNGPLREQVVEWTKTRGKSPRLYPAALLWCLKKPGCDLRDKVERMLAWKRVDREISDPNSPLGSELDRGEHADVQAKVAEATDEAQAEVWAGFRFLAYFDSKEPDGIATIDLGAGHASSSESLCGRIIAALKSRGLLSESPGASYVDRAWPQALKESGAWPLASLRQSFLNGSLTRVLDPDAWMRSRIPEFVLAGELGLASGRKADGTYQRVWFEEMLSPDEVTFEPDVFLLRKATGKALKSGKPEPQPPKPGAQTGGQRPEFEHQEQPGQPEPPPGPQPATEQTLRLTGVVPTEVWNRIGTKLIPKLKSAASVRVSVDFTVTVKSDAAAGLEADIAQILDDLDLRGKVQIERE